MSKDFSNSDTIETLAQEAVTKLRPLVTDTVAERNVLRDKLSATQSRVKELQARQEVLQTEIAELRAQGADRAMSGKSNQGVSVKISARESEHKENQGWIDELIPKGQELEKQIDGLDRKILEVLRNHIQVLQNGLEDQMNALLTAAARMRASWPRAAAAAINETADHPNLASRVTAPGHVFRLRVDRRNTGFESVGE
jgi:predicted  nucleic acid-binding Zn-ribbon protein